MKDIMDLNLIKPCFVNSLLQLDYPVYWTMKEFCEGLKRLLDNLQLDKVSTVNDTFEYVQYKTYLIIFLSTSVE